MREHRERILAICGVILFMVFFVAAYPRVTAREIKQADAVAKTEAKDECAGCHEMNPEIFTWQISSHSRIACTTCHNVKPENYKAKHDSKSFTKPVKLLEDIPNSVCEQCHTTNREATPSGDLIIPHDKHAANGITCVKCHSGVVHANIAERSLTDGGELSNYDAWNIDTARKVATKYYTDPSMWTCLKCHRAAGVTRKCSACHTAIPALPSHDLPAWKAGHGKTARTDVGECTKCHVTPGEPKFVTPSTGDPAADFARAQEFCSSCHLKRPEMHEQSMVKIHPAKAVARGIQNCLTCHTREQPKPDEKITKTYCNQCNWLNPPNQPGNSAQANQANPAD